MVIVKISIPKVKTAVLNKLPIFGGNSSHKASVCLKVGGLKRYLAEFHLNSTCVTRGIGMRDAICVPKRSDLVDPTFVQKSNLGLDSENGIKSM